MHQRKPGNTETLMTYCGTLDGDKDGVPVLIESFAIIANEFPLLKLQLIGSLHNTSTRQKIESLVKTITYRKQGHHYRLRKKK